MFFVVSFGYKNNRFSNEDEDSINAVVSISIAEFPTAFSSGTSNGNSLICSLFPSTRNSISSASTLVFGKGGENE